MSYTFKATEAFWKCFYSLPAEQKASTRLAWDKFKVDPFDPSLGTHRIHALSNRARHTIYSVVIEGDLRATFRIDGDVVTTIDIGSHAIYR